jgi:hypothetical protein
MFDRRENIERRKVCGCERQHKAKPSCSLSSIHECVVRSKVRSRKKRGCKVAAPTKITVDLDFGVRDCFSSGFIFCLRRDQSRGRD